MVQKHKSDKVSFLRALLSIISAAFGVQKKENMERDLNASNPMVFIFAALLFVALFIGGILAVVRLVSP